ncbi:MAG: PD-(D/E)XK nuclease family protein [Deltaproteobacteria bacterium]
MKFEHGEIRHSNVLAWILDPAESHGLDSTFLKKWLMRVIHEASGSLDAPFSAVDIDAWQLTSVEVRREWKNIDVLLVLKVSGDRPWIVCIENKVNASVHSDQLARYRRTVEEAFPEAEYRVFILLTKDEEEPKDENYIAASYTQVHQALRECLLSRSHAIGNEPKALLENYLRLLEENFMNESKIALTARRIYQQHRHALDVIFEHKPDNLRILSDKVREALTMQADELNIVMDSCSKAYIRFIPTAWDQPGNKHGNAWAGSIHTVVFELTLGGKRPRLYVISGKAPAQWIGPLWQLSADPPFRNAHLQNQPRDWCTLHVATASTVPLDDRNLDEPEIAVEKISKWCKDFLEEPKTQEVIKIISKRFSDLEGCFP